MDSGMSTGVRLPTNWLANATPRRSSGSIAPRPLVETRKSHSRGRNFRRLGADAGSSSGESTSSGIVKRELVLDSELMGLPETTPETGLTAYFISPLTGAFRDHIPGEWIEQHLRPVHREIPNFLPRPEAEQYLRGWSEEDDVPLPAPGDR